MKDSAMPLDIVFSVSEYLDSLNRSLKQVRARIVGEISGIQEYPGRSYLYFSIKDPKDSSTAKCFMWKQDYKNSGVSIEEGMEVVLTAYPNVYKPNGGMTLQVEEIELVGEGALKIAYEKLKAELEREGLLSEARKRVLPSLPHRIGVVTSKSGAVINDFLSNIGKYGFEIVFVDSKVEGEGAVRDLLQALKTLAKQEVDIVVLMRGGGSLESFQAFNNEMVVRAVVGFPVPVLTGIGHDKDVSLVSLVSDKNVSTPTAVANLLNESFEASIHHVRLAEEKLLGRFESLLREKQFLLENAERIIEQRFRDLFETFEMYKNGIIRGVTRIEFRIEKISETLEDVKRSLFKLFEHSLERLTEYITQKEMFVLQNNPERQLALGWSITKNKSGQVVRSIKDVNVGEVIETVLKDGTLEAKIQ